MDQTPHLVFLPSPGMGHFFPFLELAKRLVTHHQFSATILIFPDLVPKWSALELFLESLPIGLDYLLLPPPDFNGLHNDMMLHVRGIFSVTCSITSIHKVIADLSSKLNIVAIVVDHFGMDAFDIAKEFEIPSYLFYTSTVMVLSLSLALPKLDQSCTCEYRDLPDSIRLPGCIPIPGKDVMEPIQDRQSISYKLFLNSVERYHEADGIMVNTFQELECGALNGLQEEGFKPLIYPVGPIVQSNSKNHHDYANQSILSNWLDAQPSKSVLYVSFGSHWTLSQAQMNELAHGLETSNTRFLWVIRHPKDNQDGNGNSKNDDPLTCLPEGFIERTKERSLIVPYWALQQTVLGHESTGGFITHCGWNSVLESLTNGVPLIAWPLGAEQNMNALFLTKAVKVAIEVKGRAEDGVVGRDEIANIVKNLMGGGEEGKQVRERARELKLAAKMALGEGGSSSKSLAGLASKWKTM